MIIPQSNLRTEFGLSPLQMKGAFGHESALPLFIRFISGLGFRALIAFIHPSCRNSVAPPKKRPRPNGHSVYAQGYCAVDPRTPQRGVPTTIRCLSPSAKGTQ